VRLQAVFARVIYRMGCIRRGEVDDLVQECFVKLGAMRDGPLHIGGCFENEPAALGYFKTLAMNTARDHIRRETAEKRGVAKTISVEDRIYEITGSPGFNTDKSLLISQIDAVLAADPRRRAIFWLFYRQGLTTREIAGIPAFRLSQKGVESMIRRLTEVVRKKFADESEGNPGQNAFQSNG
jgi:RNA polymerase sigma-70 factor (ECF subfamily)